MKKVPHCENCDRCFKIQFLCIVYHCSMSGRKISVDKLPKTSPEWCQKRLQKEWN